MDAENQNQDNTSRQPSKGLVIILVLIALALIAQHVAFHFVLGRTTLAYETGGVRYFHWEFRGNMAPLYLQAEDEAIKLAKDIRGFFTGEDMRNLLKNLTDYSKIRNELKLSRKRREGYANDSASLVDNYNSRVESNVNAAVAGSIGQKRDIEFYNNLVKDYNSLIRNERSMIKFMGTTKFNARKRSLEISMKNIKDRINSPARNNINEGLANIGDRVAMAVSNKKAVEEKISLLLRRERVLSRDIWQKWGELVKTHEIIEEKWSGLVKTHTVVDQKLNLMEIQDADTKELHARFLAENNATIEFFNKKKTKWTELRNLDAQEESSDPRDFDARKLVDTYWLEGQSALRGQMTLKVNNQVEWLHDNGERTALGVWRKIENGQVMASFGVQYLTFNKEKNGNLTLVKKLTNGRSVTLNSEEQETYRPPEATTREREKQFMMMARLGSTDPKKFLLELEVLYKNLYGLKREFNKLARKHDLHTFQEFELIHTGKPETQN